MCVEIMALTVSPEAHLNYVLVVGGRTEGLFWNSNPARALNSLGISSGL